MIFLGIDPGINKTGVGVVYFKDNKLKYIHHEVIKTETTKSIPIRIKTLSSGLDKTIKYYQPTAVGIEDIFVSVNSKSALLLGQARGALISTATTLDCAVYEFTALQIKKAVCGYGKAEKLQVKTMVEMLLNQKIKASLDATDALACAITLAYEYHVITTLYKSFK